MKQDKVHEENSSEVSVQKVYWGKRKFVALALCAALVVADCFIGLGGGSGSKEAQVEAADYNLSGPQDDNGVTTWRCVWFGKYWQTDTNKDGKADQKDTKQPVKWRVLEFNEAKNEVLLLADKILDYQKYNTTATALTWDTSSLRLTWLYNTFYNAAFSNTEKTAVKTTSSLSTATSGSAITTSERLYILAAEDVNNSAYGFANDGGGTASATREAKYTAYAEQLGGTTDTATGNGQWWIRTQGEKSATYDQALYVDSAGKLVDGATVTDSMGVRPVVRLDLTKDVWQDAGTVSSNSALDNELPYVETTPTPESQAGTTGNPSASPSVGPSVSPSVNPAASVRPSVSPVSSVKPSASPTRNPSLPTTVPTVNVRLLPTPTPTGNSNSPITVPTVAPSGTPTVIEDGTIKQVGKIKYKIVESTIEGGLVYVSRPMKTSYKSITIPDAVVIEGITYQVTGISKRAFMGMKKLTNVSIGSNVTAIGESAFESCTKLPFLLIPQQVTSIGKRAFAGCKKLHYFVVRSSGLSTVGARSFLGTNATMKVKTPKKKQAAYKKTFKQKGRISSRAVFIVSPKVIKYKGTNY